MNRYSVNMKIKLYCQTSVSTAKLLKKSHFDIHIIWPEIMQLKGCTVVQIRRGMRYNLGIIFLLLHRKIHCDPSLEPSRGDGSNERSQCLFSLRNKKNYF